MRLRPKLLLAFLLVVLLSVGILGVIVVNLISQSIERSAREMIEHDLRMAWVEYLERSEQVRAVMQAVVAQPAVQDAVQTRDSAALRSLMQAWRLSLPYLDALIIADTKGRVLARVNNVILRNEGTDQSSDAAPFAELIAAAVVRDQAVISTEVLAPFELEREGLPRADDQEGLVAVVATPVRCAAKRVCGVIVTGDLLNGDSYIGDTLRQELHGHLPDSLLGGNLHTPTVLVSRKGTVVSGGAPSGSWLMGPVFARVERGTPYRGTATLETVSDPSFLRMTFLTAIDPIKDARGQVVGTLLVGLPEQYFWDLRNQAWGAATVVLVLGGALAMGIATVMAGRLTRPLQELTDKVQAIASGDLEVCARVGGEDEIGELGLAFNHMAEQLQRSYAELAQERSKVLASIEASRDAIWVSDAHRQMVMVNSALEQLTGRQRADLLGQTCRYLLGARLRDGRSICDTICPFLHPDREPSGTLEGYIPTTNGKDVWIEISYGRVLDPDRQIANVIHIVRDLTERKEVERLKDEFLSMVTHELRTPLHHIKGFATTLLQTDVQWDAETQRDFLSTIDHEADRLSKLVSNILQMSRIEAGELGAARRRPCRVQDLTSRALQRLRGETEAYRVQVSLPATLPPICADETGIESVIANLIENATKYAPPGSAITIEAAARAGRLIVCVADEGPGIAPEQQARIFDRFYRVSADSRAAPGVGLGLAICKRIVEAHNGRIWVESQPGSGARFYFDLPLAIQQVVNP